MLRGRALNIAIVLILGVAAALFWRERESDRKWRNCSGIQVGMPRSKLESYLNDNDLVLKDNELGSGANTFGSKFLVDKDGRALNCFIELASDQVSSVQMALFVSTGKPRN